MKGSPSTTRSILAVLAGIIAVTTLSSGTDALLHVAGVVPSQQDAWSNPQFALATGYRFLYGVVSAYIVAWFAPWRPMKHALIFGWIGFGVGIVAAAVTWTFVAPSTRWYPIAVALISPPCAWCGGKWRESQRS